ncbi:hypothetical protein [Bradyrhizobium sp. SHOUNA76]|uniref:hypothetical protein n=1 Tax=Bradyrhizobium sp. SHOUNA76 TaxID=2908927 RepID=UPI001FF16035|nr:hypothetical protein [Bradyrhizobium sp. SHOUNA76]MCJ9700198.1 hypothetical protein [Bradyrhizobium sp. SHOUNA76]
MAKKGRKAQRRRKQRRRAATPLDRMHRELGNFLTEMGRLEFSMLLLGEMISEEPLEYLFEDYAERTFGRKIQWFEERCNASEALEEYKTELTRLYADMRALKTKRNYLVHGEAYQASFKGRPIAPYRVGVTPDNVEYLDDFDHQKHGDNVFSIEQVKATTAECVKLKDQVVRIRAELIANAEPYEEEQGEDNWPPPAAAKAG